MGKQFGSTIGAKVKCSDCGITWIEGKAYNNRNIVLRDFKRKEDFYMSLDKNIRTHDSIYKNTKSIYCCPSCEPKMWELRIQSSRKAWSKNKARQDELVRKLLCYLYTRLLYGSEVELDKKTALVYSSWGEFILIHYNVKGFVHSRVVIPIGQATMRIRNLVNEKLKDENIVERTVNMNVLLKKLSLYGEY